MMNGLSTLAYAPVNHQARKGATLVGTKKLTILHSNDMHGDFLAEAMGAEGRLIGGLALLSGYISKVRQEEANVLYVIAGDMVQGSMIDSEYKGVSTMEIMNFLAPDVATLGNHELDYGLAHLLFLEKMANFPLVNANMYIRRSHKRLMQPFHIISKAGFDIMFIGIITESVMKKLATDEVGTFITLEDAAAEVGRICNAYRDQDIDLTVLLTHIGFDSDKELAALLNPDWGVDMIIGGHSHTILEQPAQVNNILITQAGVGTDQIGRFDVVVDDDSNSVVEWTWKLIPVDDKLAEPDKDLQTFIDSYAEIVDRKYNAIVCRLGNKVTHPRREIETSMGDLFADIIAERAQVDVAFVASGSLRGTELGPVVTLGALRAVYPYIEPLHKCTVSGALLRHMFAQMMHPSNRTGEGECYQVNRGVKAVYNTERAELISLTLNGQPVQDDQRYTICLQEYHFRSAERIFRLPAGALDKVRRNSIVATSGRDVLEEYLSASQNLTVEVEGRLEYQ
jgi:5'-nucleotidase / UDP-sugar diphosphatase